MNQNILNNAREAYQNAEAILVGAGAGMGVDSGLPDFRGKDGFWKAYPPLAKLGIQFEEMANPQWFITNPQLAWGFYGHRLNLYRKTLPHLGFELLHKKHLKQKTPTFIFTSNVDGHFQKSGFKEKQIIECHGSLLHLQCSQLCGYPIWPVDSKIQPQIDSLTLYALEPLPACPECGSIARPNILMFCDRTWENKRCEIQKLNLQNWLNQIKNKKLLVLEIGAGTNIPTVRSSCEQIFYSLGDSFIRINLRESECGINGAISLPMKAKEALSKLMEGEGR